MKITYVLSVLFILFLTSCEKVIGEGALTTETRSTADFTGIESEISGNIYYTQGADHKVELTAQQNILNVIETPVLGDRLVVRFKKFVRVRAHEQITIRITAPSLNSIGSSGAGNITVLSPLNSSQLSFRLSGSGNMQLPSVQCSQMEANLSGSGNISISSGVATSELLRISGSGGIDARHVVSKSVTTHTSGSGTMWVQATDNLDVNISGSGSVYYWGNPGVTTSISGSGRVVRQ